MSRNWYTVALQAVLALIVAGALVVSSFAGGWLAYDRVFAYMGTAKPISPPEAMSAGGDGNETSMSLLWEAVQLLRDHYYGGGVPEGSQLTYSAIRGVLNATDDQFTTFVDPEHAKLLREDMQGEFQGIGATVRMNDSDELMIVSPIPGSPAQEAGLRSGDIILAADGQRLKGMTVMEAVTIIRGPQGSTIELEVLREGEGTFTVDITRDTIEIPTVESRIIAEEGQPTLGYLKLNDFNARATDELRDALRQLESDGAEGLVLDVRNNPGGFLRTAIEVTSQFIEEGEIVLIERTQEEEQIHRARSGGLWLDKPMVVLVNGGSASASEILAGAIQDHERGMLVGTTTFGKGSVQAPHTLSDDSSLRVTIARWFTPDDRMIHEKGIEPDVSVELTAADERNSRDPQLEQAIDTLVQNVEQAQP